MSSKNKRFKAASKAAAASTPVYRGDHELGILRQWPDDRIGEWVVRQVNHRMRSGLYEHVDNWRWAEDGVEVQMQAYLKIRSSGCCGSEDFQFKHPGTGRVFHVGFNYGH
jgi:hypothetical protein